MKKKDLDKILKEHKKWLENYGGERADLSNADLIDANLCDANLIGADLRYANLICVKINSFTKF